MRKLLLSPRWWGLHLLVVTMVLVMLRLGLWQWHRAESSSGGIQNFAYAFQWPLFAVFTVALWWKTLRIELVGQNDETGTAERPLSRLGAKPLPEPEIGHRDGVRIGITTVHTDPDEDDEEVRIYNAYLARLHAQSAASSPRGSR
jgi:hypothetical protein